MLTCNLFKTVHNIWLQQSNNRGACLLATTFDNYMQTFKQSSLYFIFYKEVHLGLIRTKMNYTCLGPISLGTHAKLLL